MLVKFRICATGCCINFRRVFIMANLIVVCGPQAVGKMTVAESLRDKLKYNMMMNHDSIEMSDKIFGSSLRIFKKYSHMGTLQ